MTIGERIKERRIELKLTQRELATKMGYSHHSTLARIEAGKVDVSQTRIVQFSKALDVSIAYLMGWEEKKAKEIQKNNDAISSIVVRLRTDDKFLSIVEEINKLDDEKLSNLLAFIK